MAHDLSSGSRLIRTLQVTAFLVACAGGVATVMLAVDGDAGVAGFYVPVILGAFVLDALLLVVVMRMLSARGLVRRINLLAAAFDKGAEGDLTVRVDLGTGDELGGLGGTFNGMLGRLAGMVTGINTAIFELRRIASRNNQASSNVLAAAKIQSVGVAEACAALAAINRSAEQVVQGVGKLASSSADNAASLREMTESIVEVRRNVEAQAAAIQDVSSSITETVAVVEETNRNVAGLKKAATATSTSAAEMDLSIRQVEKSTRETVAIAQAVRDEAYQGKQAAEATIAGMGGIRDSSGTTFTSISQLSDRVAAIGNIVSVIEELTEQTNLLALNSAILAAQAGEHGKGFAIVAGEIKELANRTKRSTSEIAGLIEGIREETQRAVAAIRTTEQRVAEGENLARRSGETLDRIVASVQAVAGQIQEIARVAEEQASGSRKIHAAMHDVANMVAQIASSTQEQTSTSRAIVGSVQWMTELTNNVLASTSRQEEVGAAIAETTAQMAEVVEMIRVVSLEQAGCCDHVTGSVTRVRQSAEGNLDSAEMLQAADENLAAQIEVLREEIGKLQVT